MSPNVLKENASVPFVKRILEPEKYPVKKNPDGSISTHLMSSAQIDGRHFAFPTLRLQGDNLVEDKSPMTAYRTGNVVFFDTAEEADEFARGSWKSMVPDFFSFSPVSSLLKPFIRFEPLEYIPKRKEKNQGFVNANEAFDFSSLSDK
tara:strand:- start:4 stop:447 length:444 start_codon:yes stop_codon:yes gene_type:complete